MEWKESPIRRKLLESIPEIPYVPPGPVSTFVVDRALMGEWVKRPESPQEEEEAAA